MEGFDKTLTNSLLAAPAFQREFGTMLPDGSYEITPAWQAALTNAALIGEVCGLMLNGIIADRFGYKKTMIGALIVTTGLIFIVFFTRNLVQLLVGLITLGLPWGTNHDILANCFPTHIMSADPLLHLGIFQTLTVTVCQHFLSLAIHVVRALIFSDLVCK